MKKPAPPAGTTYDMLDRQIAGAAALGFEAEIPTAGTGAGDGLSELEAALLTMSLDLAAVRRYAAQVQEQGQALETFARALAADMEAVKAAVRDTKTRS